jgi:hypothetical protein
MNINFFEIEESQLISYNYFKSQVNNNDLLELNGYKIRNIISLTFTEQMKNIVIENIFNSNGTFLSSQTQENLYKYLSPEEICDFKVHLSNYLDIQINSGWLDIIKKTLNENSINTLIIPTLALENQMILKQLKLLFPNKKFIDWLNFNEKSKVLILDFNHVWKKRNIFTLNQSITHSCFLKHFFENPYYWKIYNDEKIIYKSINTSTRISIFSSEVIDEIKIKLDSLKPKFQENGWARLLDEDLNNTYNYVSKDEIKLYFENQRGINYPIKNSFILFKNNEFLLKNGTELIESTHIYEGEFKIANLDNIISSIDIKKITDAIEKDKSIYKIIFPLWEKYNLNEKNGSLWKQLLKRKSDFLGIDKVFSDIEEISNNKQFVSLYTFENTYCNPENKTIIPRAKKIFKSICQYLELPMEYRAAIQRERNLIGENSEEGRLKIKALISIMIECKIFDQPKDDESLLESINHSVDKIENNVDIDFFGSTRESLIYSCIAIYYEVLEKLKLKLIVKIEQIIPN